MTGLDRNGLLADFVSQELPRAGWLEQKAFVALYAEMETTRSWKLRMARHGQTAHKCEQAKKRLERRIAEFVENKTKDI